MTVAPGPNPPRPRAHCRRFRVLHLESSGRAGASPCAAMPNQRRRSDISDRTRAAIARTWNRAAVHTLHPSERPRCSKRFSRYHFGIVGPQTKAIIDALEDEGPVS